MPRNPGAWLMTTAKNRQIDLARRTAVFRRKREELARSTELTSPAPEPGRAIEDDVLRLIFTTCHPALSRESQVALTLRMLGGLTTGEIARALLTSEATVGTRISRAKRTLADAGSPFEIPGEDELTERLSSVLAVVYLIFNEGYSATSGDDLLRIELCADALRLGRMLQALLPDEAEAQGLSALMELQSSRLRARTDSSGAAIPLDEQDRGLWDRLLIERGLAALDRAFMAPGSKGPYTLQAQIAAAHARAETFESTDWQQISELYGLLSKLTRSPVIEVNRAIAVGFAEGPTRGLEILERIAGDPQLASYPYFYGARGELLERDGRIEEAQKEFAAAAAATTNARERETFLRRANGESGARSS